jgi:hypothetical protein
MLQDDNAAHTHSPRITAFFFFQYESFAPFMLLFGPLKQRIEAYRFHDYEEVEMAVCEWLQMQKICFYCDGILKSPQDETNAKMSWGDNVGK